MMTYSRPDIQVIKRWTVRSFVYRGEPVILASYGFPDRRSSPLHLGFQNLAENFDGFGFRQLDRYLSVVPNARADCAVGLVESGLVIQFDGVSLFPGCEYPEDGWLRIARNKGVCIVALTVDGPSDAAESALLRLQSAKRMLLGGALRFSDRRGSESPNSSRYRVLGSDGDTTLPVPATKIVLLDSNVLLDLEKAARLRLSDPLRRELSDLVRNLWHQDCRPGFALGELCWSGPFGRFREDRAAGLYAAMDAWFDEKTEDALDADSLHDRWHRAVERHSIAKNPLAESDIRPIILPIYCSLLKLATLLIPVAGFRARQRVALLADYCDWVSNDLAILITYPLQIAIDSLVGPGSKAHYTRRLLKFGRDILHDLWGAAWDLSMLAMADMLANDERNNPQGFGASLATADKAMIELRSRLRLVGRTEDLGKRPGAT